MRDAAEEVWKYADPTSFDLRHALARHHDVAMENIVVGEGIDGLLGYLVRMLVEPGQCVVTSAGAYPTFNYHVVGYGGTIETVPYQNDHEDLDALLTRAAETNAKLVYFANPDNPMGTWHNGAYIEARLDKIPDGTLLVLDEAYIEFADDNVAPKIDINDPRVIRMRTFSKAYGMAGARVGYALGAPQLIAEFEKIRNHFGMSRISQIGALAALSDQDWIKDVNKHVAKARGQIAQIADQNGMTTLPSATNFVALDCGQDDVFARAVLEELAQNGIFVRMPSVPPLNRCIRISVGPDEDLDLVARVLPKVLEKLRS